MSRDKAKKSLYDKKYYKKNKDKKLKMSKQYYQENKNSKLLYQKSYYEDHKEDRLKYASKYRKENWDKAYSYKKEKRKNDVHFKLADWLRNRIRDALKGNFKAGSAVKDLGCSIEELKQRLEQQFKSGMTWENHSFKGWHIDHIKPLASFDLTNRKQFLEACHYTNLQPLWAKENLSKGTKII